MFAAHVFRSSPARRLASDSGGNVAVIFALVMVAVIGVAGFAIDFERTISAETKMQSALDASALAGARSLEDARNSDADVRETTLNMFRAGLGSAAGSLDCADPDVSIDRKSGRVTVDADCSLPTAFGGVLRQDSVRLREAAAARAAMTRLDVAMMLDVSGSMKGAKIEDLKEAAKDAVDILISDTSGDRVRIAFNTYATSVNVGDYASKVFRWGRNANGTQCASERSGSAALGDEAPGAFAWMGTGASECPESSILPLTSDRDALHDEIDELKADGYTAGHLGVAWAWYLIAPDWASVWPDASRPHAYDEPDAVKAVILMTDGEFNTRYDWRLGSSEEQASNLCKEMRDAGVVIYSVAFKAPSSGRKILRDCADAESRFFKASNGRELKDAYRAIASQLTNLALTD